jgi:hypothetical protein
MTGPGTDRDISAAFICQESQIHRRKFPGKFLVVQFRQTDDIIDQREKTVRVVPDLLCDMPYLIMGDHIVFQEFRITGDGCQGSLELMGYIGSEILAYGSRLQDIFMLGADLVRKGLQFPIDRLLYGTVQTLRHFVQRSEELDGQEMAQKDSDHHFTGLKVIR